MEGGGIGGRGSSVQRVLTVIPGRNTQAARQFNYAPLCPLIPAGKGVAVVGVGAIRKRGISACRNICCNIVENFFSQELRSAPLCV